MTGLTFNDLTVLRRSGVTDFGEAKWLCRCVCGTEVYCAGSVLRRGTKKSCGCRWRATFEDTKVCSRCKVELPHASFYRTKGGQLESHCIACRLLPCARFYRLNPELYSARRARVVSERNARRARILEAYGGKCACCGEVEVTFLTIDHKNGNGREHRAEVGGQDAFYKWIEEQNYPDTLQCLCMNCNWGRYRHGGTCPHQRRLQ
jgi:hypothetical protein